MLILFGGPLLLQRLKLGQQSIVGHLNPFPSLSEEIKPHEDKGGPMAPEDVIHDWEPKYETFIVNKNINIFIVGCIINSIRLHIICKPFYLFLILIRFRPRSVASKEKLKFDASSYLSANGGKIFHYDVNPSAIKKEVKSDVFFRMLTTPGASTVLFHNFILFCEYNCYTTTYRIINVIIFKLHPF